MDDAKKWTNVFNEKFVEFTTDLIELFPDDKDFKMCKQSFNLLKLVDEREPVRKFRMYAAKYEDRIMKKDEQFLLEHDFDEEINMTPPPTGTNISVDILMKLKNYWKCMAPENKETVWSYLILLYKVNARIVI